MLLMRVVTLAAVACGVRGEVPVFENTCYDNDPRTPCPVSSEATGRYLALATEGGSQPAAIELDPACRESERDVHHGGSNASRCLQALRARKRLDDQEPWPVCNATAFLAHTWWDGPMVRVVQLFLRSFRATQNPTCAKLVVWTPTTGSERSTPEARAMCEQVEAMAGAPVAFQELSTREMAQGTLFEAYVDRSILPQSWETSDSKAKSESTKHFSDFFQLFVLWRYGGIYFDADQVLLRDLRPLWGLDFEYQWSFIPDKFNNAVQGLHKGGGETLIRKGWGNTLWAAKVVAKTKTYGLPCMSFDPYWLRMDGHHTGEGRNPSLDYPPNDTRNWLFTSPYTAVGDWYEGAFGIHWHGGAGAGTHQLENAWTPAVRAGSYVEHWERLYS